MPKSNDEIYDQLVALNTKVEKHIEVAVWRLNALEGRATRTWALWLALIGPFIALPVGVISLLKG